MDIMLHTKGPELETWFFKKEFYYHLHLVQYREVGSGELRGWLIYIMEDNLLYLKSSDFNINHM